MYPSPRVVHSLNYCSPVSWCYLFTCLAIYLLFAFFWHFPPIKFLSESYHFQCDLYVSIVSFLFLSSAPCLFPAFQGLCDWLFLFPWNTIESSVSPELDLQSHNSTLQVLTHCQVSGSERNHFVFPLYCATQLTPAFLAIFCFIRHFCIQYFAIAIWIVLRSLKPLSLKLNGSLCQSLYEPPELLLSVDWDIAEFHPVTISNFGQFLMSFFLSIWILRMHSWTHRPI